LWHNTCVIFTSCGSSHVQPRQPFAAGPLMSLHACSRPTTALASSTLVTSVPIQSNAILSRPTCAAIDTQSANSSSCACHKPLHPAAHEVRANGTCNCASSNTYHPAIKLSPFYPKELKCSGAEYQEDVFGRMEPQYSGGGLCLNPSPGRWGVGGRGAAVGGRGKGKGDGKGGWGKGRGHMVLSIHVIVSQVHCLCSGFAVPLCSTCHHQAATLAGRAVLAQLLQASMACLAARARRLSQPRQQLLPTAAPAQAPAAPGTAGC